MDALENAAIAQDDFAHAEVGDGFKFGGHAGGRRQRRRYFTVSNGFVAQPFPKPAVFKRIWVEAHNKKGIVAVMIRAIVVIIPEKELVGGRVGVNAIDERTGGLGGGPGQRRVK